LGFILIEPMEKFSNLIVKFRWVVLSAIVLITAFFSYQLKFLEVDSNVIDALPNDDKIVTLFKDVGKRFGGTEIGMVIVESENVFRSEVLRHIEQVTDTLAVMDGLLSVTSITNIMRFNVEGDNFEIDDLISRHNWPETEKDAEIIRDRVTSDKMISGNIVSKDGKATVIIFTFQGDANTNNVSRAVIEKIENLQLPEKIYFAGAPFMKKYVADVVSTDMMKLIPISFLLIAFILYLSFHSLRGVILPLLTAGLAIVWAIGTFVLLGMKLSMVSNNVPIIILAVGSAYAIHVLNRINQFKSEEPKKAVAKALPLILAPVILTALTTMIGFLSFIFGAYLSMIRDFGILAALGTLYSGLLAIFLVPALLATIPRRKKISKEKSVEKNENTHLNNYVLLPFYKAVISHPSRIIGIWIFLFLVGVIGIFMLKRSVSVSEYFKSGHPVTVSDKIIEEKFGGSSPIFIVYKGDMLSPELLKNMHDLQAYMKASPYITNAQSISDIVVNINGALSGEEKIPDEKEKIQQLWFLIGQNENINQLVTEDLDQGIIVAKFNNKGQSEVEKFDKYLMDYLKANESENFTVEVTGMPYVMVQMDKSLVKSQITSLLIAVILVITVISFMFRSLREGINASFPILATIAILYGFMGFTGIPLNIATVLVASVAMGIGIDYSIHFISHFNHRYKKSHNINESLKDTILISGKAIFVNFISVAAGFSVLVFSDLVPMVYFGILIALSMFGSSMGALTLLPATILIGLRKKSSTK